MFVAGSVPAAHGYGRARPGTLRLGESAGITLLDADLGNSPVAAGVTCFDDTAVVASTTNGTAAIVSVTSASLGLLGRPRNATAAARAAFEASLSSGDGVAIVRAGADGGSSVAQKDVLVAGFLVAKPERLACAYGRDPVIGAGAESAVSLVRAAQLDGDNGATAWYQLLAGTTSGIHLRALGRDGDIAYAADVDATTVVPRVLTTTEDGTLVEVGSAAVLHAGVDTSMLAVPCS